MSTENKTEIKESEVSIIRIVRIVGARHAVEDYVKLSSAFQSPASMVTSTPLRYKKDYRNVEIRAALLGTFPKVIGKTSEGEDIIRVLFVYEFSGQSSVVEEQLRRSINKTHNEYKFRDTPMMVSVYEVGDIEELMEEDRIIRS